MNEGCYATLVSSPSYLLQLLQLHFALRYALLHGIKVQRKFMTDLIKFVQFKGMQRIKDFLGSKEEIRARSGSYDSHKSSKTESGGSSGNGGGRVWSCSDSKGFLALPGIIEIKSFQFLFRSESVSVFC